MSDLPIRPEAVEAAFHAYEDATPTGFCTRKGLEAAIAAFCEAEGLTVEEERFFSLRYEGDPNSKGAAGRRRRLVGPWYEEER